MALRRSRTHSRPRQALKRRGPTKLAIAEPEAGFPVVAIGASAGGLDAFRILLSSLSAKTGMAFILVQHLDPIHESRMVELLSPRIAMPVLEARDGMCVEPDHVYIIPPGQFLAVGDATIRLSRPPPGQFVRLPFDFLLHSLAEAFGERAVCIVLSGTATDGSVGAKAIKEKGGLVIAQDPREAEYDGMPLSAIASRAVDLILPLADIPEALAKYAGHPYVKTGNSDAPRPFAETAAKITNLLRKKTPHDFALYKNGTITRRIERRMAMAGIDDGDRYIKLLTEDRAELERLANDLLINVTGFFRDPKIFDLLREKIVPELVRAEPPPTAIRIWVAGCSTGEEAYSIAMLFLEEIAAAQLPTKLQIFASDIDDDAIAVAREGLYAESIEADVAQQRLKRFFTHDERGYRVSRELRATIAFSVHDLLADAPFSHLDFISCRNLLIYLRPEVQKKVLGLFHFALREGGILFLGTAEAVGDAGDRFEPVALKQRIYRHVATSKPGEVTIPFGRGEAARVIWPRAVRLAGTPAFGINEPVAQRLLLESYAPASVLINRKYQSLYYFGPVDRYLKMPPGVASLDLFASAREGLRPAIRAAIENMNRGHGRAATITGQLKRDGRHRVVTVTARAVKADGDALILLSFTDVPKPKRKIKTVHEPRSSSSRVARLEQELDITRKDLASAIRDRETADEDLRAVNEEAMSVNEEFQTTNEELETSKEELQSLNEELTTLNNQLQGTVAEYQSVANDFENILNSSSVATLFLDTNLNIRFFTPVAKALFSVISSDIGRPLSDLARNFTGGDLSGDARKVLADLAPLSREVLAENGAWYNSLIVPYRTKDNRIEGVVITFSNITERRKANEALHAAKALAETANIGKSRFLAAASHDLRQPLQTLSLLQGLLAKQIKDEDATKLVSLSLEAVTAMSGMLNTLLNINQLEAGVIRPEIVDFKVSNILERLNSEFAYHAENRALDWRVLPCRLTVHGDPRLLEQMLRNLLSNAMKYTKKGGVLLGCRRRGRNLRIEVWDTGFGIPKEQLRAIFEEFHQIGNPAHELSKGLGLGLAIVQRLGSLLGHTVDVRSRMGRGSVFSVDVPLASKIRPAAPKAVAREAKKSSAASGLILIVEDDPAVRGSLEIFLRSEGHRTMAVADGDEAMALLALEGPPPDLAIVDHNLPGHLTGLEVITKLREMTRREVPALILTGDISTETLSEIDRKGYVHHGKPLEAQDLIDYVRSLLPEKP